MSPATLPHPDDLEQLARRSPAVIFGHADADGHLAAEQTRRNLTKAGVKIARVVVSNETSNYRFWTDSFTRTDFSDIGLVVAVDLAFSFKNPASSWRAILATARRYPQTDFIVIDHHPLPSLSSCPVNVVLRSVNRVYDCCLGQPSQELMAIASICDGGVVVSLPRLRTTHLKRAVGLKRAVADGRFTGERILSLLRRRQWQFFEALADEPAESHRTVRGRRTARSLTSPLLHSALAG